MLNLNIESGDTVIFHDSARGIKRGGEAFWPQYEGGKLRSLWVCTNPKGKTMNGRYVRASEIDLPATLEAKREALMAGIKRGNGRLVSGGMARELGVKAGADFPGSM